MNPICVTCRREMHCARNGYTVRSGPETASPWTCSGDKYRCPSCGSEVVVGFGRMEYDQNLVEALAAEEGLALKEDGR